MVVLTVKMVYYFHCQNSHGFSLRATPVSFLADNAIQVPRDLICLFMQTLYGFRSLSPSYALLAQRGPSHLPFGDACIFPPSLSYDPLPPQNLASHNLVSRRQSVVVLTVKMVYYLGQNIGFLSERELKYARLLVTECEGK